MPFTRLIDGLVERHEQRRARREQAAHVAAGRLSIGLGTYGPFRLLVHRGDENTRVTIGRYCAIGRDVLFIPGSNHRVDWASSYPFRVRYQLPGRFEDGHPASRGPIVVGNDVWIGHGARILSGVRIGDGAVVSAAAVVATDVRPYAIVAGNPAREARRRFSDEQVEALERLAWWDWPEQRILDSVALLNGPVEALLARHSQ
jgi:acetyltransferase-like isoleucine patch superfamily enzyme